MDAPPKLPIKLDATSNGEFAPIPLPREARLARAAAVRTVAANADRKGLDRRAFFASLCASASTLAAFNAAHAAAGRTGGRFALAPEAQLEPEAAALTLSGDEFIFDVHTHMVDPTGAWRSNHGRYWEEMLAGFPQARCGEADPVDCFAADYYVREIFENSDTDVAVLSFVPETPEANPLNPKEAMRTRTLVGRMDDARDRLLLHAMVVPNLRPYGAQREAMRRAAAEWPIAAWKVYTQWGPDGQGWRLDDPEIGVPFIETARALGVRNICIHKGLPFPGMPLENAGCADIGAAARMFPDMNFLVYHLGFTPGVEEGPFDPDAADPHPLGIDSLVRSLIEHDVAPGSNVYADLGATWWILMRYPDAAAHVLGKLLTHVGPDRVLWGTDCIWFGSPQDQIQMMRSFEISGEFIERYGYPPLSRDLKRRIFGLNGAAVYGIDPDAFQRHAGGDWIGRKRHAAAGLNAGGAGMNAGEAGRGFETYGPGDAREYAAYRRAHPTPLD